MAKILFCRRSDGGQGNHSDYDPVHSSQLWTSDMDYSCTLKKLYVSISGFFVLNKCPEMIPIKADISAF
jgi:hypothetical protein